MCTQKLLLSFLILSFNLCHGMKQEEAAAEVTITLDELLADFKNSEQDTGSVIVHTEAPMIAEEPKQLLLKLSDQQILMPWERAIYSLYFTGKRDDMRGLKPRPRLSGVFECLQQQKVKINRVDSQKILSGLNLVYDEIERKSKHKKIEEQSLESLQVKAEEAEQILKNLASMDGSDCVAGTIKQFGTLKSQLKQPRVRADAIFQQEQTQAPPVHIALWKKVMTYVLPGYCAQAKNSSGSSYNLRRLHNIKTAVDTILLWPFLYKLTYTMAQYTKVTRNQYRMIIPIVPSLCISALCAYSVNKIFR